VERRPVRRALPEYSWSLRFDPKESNNFDPDFPSYTSILPKNESVLLQPAISLETAVYLFPDQLIAYSSPSVSLFPNLLSIIS